ncbi:acyl-CoA N-acyltransferase [Aspergillus pseudoustus]|uniref:Acyl-CoA N-acyltransferase n=1 Tax=Aspergillus pseudoustus TaxID=1810923 RepID=A0ABR4KUI2_9EURO
MGTSNLEHQLPAQLRVPQGLNQLAMPDFMTVTPVFGGFKFKAKDHAQYESFPPEWIVCLDTKIQQDGPSSGTEQPSQPFTVPSLDHDALYLSSISLPSRKDIKPGSAPTRQVAMVLWITCFCHNATSDQPGRDGDTNPVWRLNIQRRGMLCRKGQMMKLERLGLIASFDASVGAESELDDFSDMFVSQRAFWHSVEDTPKQICPSPTSSLDSLGMGFPFGAGPKTGDSFLPSYYPPQPLQYVYTGDVHHPLRPKSYRQGEVFYVRYVPIPVMPVKNNVQRRSEPNTYSGSGPDLCLDTELANDLKIVYDWLQKRPRDTAILRKGSIEDQSDFLKERLSSQNSFPALVLEDPLGRFLDNLDDYDRGVRCFIGDEQFLEPHCLRRCVSALVHHCWLYDQRTHTVVSEFRADNLDITSALRDIGFTKLEEIRLPDTHNMIMQIKRDSWVAPEL